MANMRKSAVYGLYFLGLVAFCVWYFLLSQHKPSGLLTVAFLSVGQGDAIYIEAPNGRQMLIDGGPKGSLMKPLQAVMPPGDSSIDVVLITHPDADHYAGLVDLFERYSVGVVIESDKVSTAKAYLQLQTLIKEDKVTKILARKGTVVSLDDTARVAFTVLFPDGNVSKVPTNDASIVGRLAYGNTSVMFTGDAPVSVEGRILEQYSQQELESSILKVGHHGSRTSTSLDFLKAVYPNIAVISAGKNNTYGHPHQEILEKLENLGIRVLTTDTLGTIMYTSDGTEWKMVEKR